MLASDVMGRGPGECVEAIALLNSIHSPDADKQTSGYAYRLLMTTSEAVVIGGLQIPPKAVPYRWPEHEVSGQLSGERVCRFPVLIQVSPLRPHTEHKFGLLG